MSPMPPEPETLKLLYEDLLVERDRLRDARRWLNSQMTATLTASALVEGLFAAFWSTSDSPWLDGLFGFSLLLFVAIVVIAFYSPWLTPYRRLREEYMRGLSEDEESLSSSRWLRRRIEMERQLYGADESDERGMQYGYARERTRLRRAQYVFISQVSYLVLVTAVARPFLD